MRCLVHFMIASGLAAWAGLPAAQDNGEKPTKAVPELELAVAGKTYDVVAGSPLTIVTPKGEHVRVRVSYKRELTFEGGGVKFKYPRGMLIEVNKGTGFAMITVEDETSAMVMIQNYMVPTSPKRLMDVLLPAMRDEMKSRGAKMPDQGWKAVRRDIAGAARQGKSLEFELVGEKVTMEVYTMRVGKRVVAVCLQWMDDDTEHAKALYPMILDSLK